ncbi:MAG: DUF2442 domain-containing protein [Gemmatimonadaceae bacterium]
MRAELQAARALERADRRRGARARSARYDSRTGRVVLVLTNGAVFEFPSRIVPALRNLTREQLRHVDLSPSGGGLLWDAQDVQVSVPGVLMASLGPGETARELARLAGSVRSTAKTRAARENGARGGRPRKKAAAR